PIFPTNTTLPLPHTLSNRPLQVLLDWTRRPLLYFQRLNRTQEMQTVAAISAMFERALHRAPHVQDEYLPQPMDVDHIDHIDPIVDPIASWVYDRDGDVIMEYGPSGKDIAPTKRGRSANNKRSTHLPAAKPLPAFKLLPATKPLPGPDGPQHRAVRPLPQSRLRKRDIQMH
ncbi:hypothetical protein FA15DRAFT_714339, partial [Coprinopsis marcescibilis]